MHALEVVPPLVAHCVVWIDQSGSGSTIVDISPLSPGHQTELLARSRLLTIPRCPSCIRSRISCHTEFGTTMRSSYTSNSSAIDR